MEYTMIKLGDTYGLHTLGLGAAVTRASSAACAEGTGHGKEVKLRCFTVSF